MSYPVETQMNLVNDIGDSNIAEYVKDLKSRLELIHRIHNSQLQANATKLKETYDATVARPYDYKIGEKVYLKDSVLKKGESKKLKRPFTGPYLITQKLGNHNVQLQEISTGRILPRLIHVNRIKLMNEQVDKENTQVDARTEENNKATDTTPVVDSTTIEKEKDSLLGNSSRQVLPKEDKNEVENKDEYYPAEKIIRSRVSNGERQFLVVWKSVNGVSFPASWVKEDDLTQDLLEDYNMKYTKQGKRRKMKYRR